MPKADKSSPSLKLQDAYDMFLFFATDKAPRAVHKIIRNFAPSRGIYTLLTSKLVHRAVFTTALTLRWDSGIHFPETRSESRNGNLIIIRKPTSLQETTGTADTFWIHLPRYNASPPLRGVGHHNFRMPWGTQILPKQRRESFPLLEFTAHTGPQPSRGRMMTPHKSVHLPKHT
jgi:hypothetical protein